MNSINFSINNIIIILLVLTVTTDCLGEINFEKFRSSANLLIRFYYEYIYKLRFSYYFIYIQTITDYNE